MENLNMKEKVKISELRKRPKCCSTGPAAGECSPEGRNSGGVRAKAVPAVKPAVKKVSGEWTAADYMGRLRCRVGSFRMRYRVDPGLYAIGEPDNNSDVLVSANYKLSFDTLRRALRGLNAWILVLDTKGINVWCAAGKGTFGTDELVKSINDVSLSDLVSHRKVIVPQLGAPGVAAHTVEKRTGFRVYYGPVDAEDIRAYIEAGYKATEAMRRIGFTFLDRLILTPMEMTPAMRKYPAFALATLLIFGLEPAGVYFKEALARGMPFLFLGLMAILSGTFITPVFINIIPFRAFALKGWLAGLFMTFLTSKVAGVYEMNVTLRIFTFLFFPLVSSYLALQFTGSTVFTGISGVKKELRFAIPVYLLGVCVSASLLVIFKLNEWGAI